MCGYYKVEGTSKKFEKIRTARKAAIDLFPYYKDMGNPNPIIKIYWCNVVGKSEIGRVLKGPGYPIYVDEDGIIYRLTKTGMARRL